MNKFSDIYFWCTVVPFILASCSQKDASSVIEHVITKPDTISVNTLPSEAVVDSTHSEKSPISALEKQIIDAGFINIHAIDTSIQVDLKYNSTDNFMHQVLYQNLSNAFMPDEVAQKLHKAQVLLKNEFPDYSLIIFDAARPLSVQQYIWDSVKLRPYEKYQYISPPNQISLHNYGAAVDLSIINTKNDSLLEMGTPFDFFGKQAQPRYEAFYLVQGELTEQHIKNRELLRKVMQQAGFYGITTEWWHFNSTNKWVAAKRYTLIK